MIGGDQVFHLVIRDAGRLDQSSGSGKPDTKSFHGRYDSLRLRITSEFPVGGFGRFGGSFGLAAVILPAGRDRPYTVLSWAVTVIDVITGPHPRRAGIGPGAVSRLAVGIGGRDRGHLRPPTIGLWARYRPVIDR